MARSVELIKKIRDNKRLTDEEKFLLSMYFICFQSIVQKHVSIFALENRGKDKCSDYNKPLPKNMQLTNIEWEFLQDFIKEFKEIK